MTEPTDDELKAKLAELESKQPRDIGTQKEAPSDTVRMNAAHLDVYSSLVATGGLEDSDGELLAFDQGHSCHGEAGFKSSPPPLIAATRPSS